MIHTKSFRHRAQRLLRVRASQIMLLALGACAPQAASTPPPAPLELELHLMSKCPFGNAMLRGVLPVAEGLGDRVSLRVHHIGREEDGRLASDRGDEELDGDKLQVCVQAHADSAASRRFLACQSAAYLEIPRGWQACAEQAGIDPSVVRDCSEGREGNELLAKSFQRSAQQGIEASPTLLIAGARYEGARTPAALGRQLCNVLSAPKPELCGKLPPPVAVGVTLVQDARCPAELCDTRGLQALLQRATEDARIRSVDVSSEEGRALFAAAGYDTLPVAIFDPAIEQEPALASHFKEKMRALEGRPGFAYRVGKHWNPSAEICDDARDNTSDGLIDCADATCEGSMPCRAEVAGKLELFVMSKCPYGARAVAAANALLTQHARDRKRVDFELGFAGSTSEAGAAPQSLRGEPELAEDRRQLCAQAHYAKDYAFMDYVLCRNADQTRDDWEGCAVGGIDADVLRACAEGDEGRALLERSFEEARLLRVRHSPSGLVNGRFELTGFGPDQLRRALCEHNPGHATCEGSDG